MLSIIMEQLLEKKDLSKEEMKHVFSSLIKGTEDIQASALLSLMRAKGESEEEIACFVEEMRKEMLPLQISTPVLDIVGTGGDKSSTLNISTASALLAASCGVKIAKHGNKSVSSKCGSADFIQGLGINIENSPKKICQSIDEIGIGFIFAPLYHPLLQRLKDLREKLGIRTILNLVGPLLNPAKPDYMILGVYDPSLLPLYAKALIKLGTKRSMVVHCAGIDEISCIAPTHVAEVCNHNIRYFEIHPNKLGFKNCSLKDLQGDLPGYNVRVLLKIFEGEEHPAVETILLNSAVALYLYGISPTIKEGICLAKQSLREKKVLRLIEKWRSLHE